MRAVCLALLMSTYVKLFNLFPDECTARARDVFKAYTVRAPHAAVGVSLLRHSHVVGTNMSCCCVRHRRRRHGVVANVVRSPVGYGRRR